MAQQTSTVAATRTRAQLMDLVLLVLVNMMFGAQYPATKTAVTEMGPVLLSVLTFGLAGLCMTPFFIWESRRHPDQPPILNLFRGHNLFPFMMATVGGYFPGSVVLAWGIDRSLASNAALLTLTIPVNTALLASVVRQERMNLWKWLSFGLAITGAIISSDIDWHSLNVVGKGFLLGNMLILTACWGSAFTNVYSKGLLEQYQPVRLLMASYFVTAVVCLPLLFWLERPHWSTFGGFSPHTWAGLGILGVFSWGLAMILFFRVLSRLEVTQVSLSIYLIPVFGISLAAFFLHERISASIIIGGLLALAGTSLILLADNSEAPGESSQGEA